MNLSKLTHRDQLGSFLNECELLGTGVEVGTFYGEFMEVVMDKWRGEKMICIDPWEKQDPSVYKEPLNDANWNEVLASASGRALKYPGRVELRRAYSPKAAAKFFDGELDWCYLDGRHDLKSAQEDLDAWWPKVKSGGLFGGHDFYDCDELTKKCGVKSAVIQFAIDHGLAIHLTHGLGDSGWWIAKE